MIQKLKQWWIAIVGMALVIFDLGFDAVNPVLTEMGVSGKWISIIKVLFGIYGIYRLYNINPQAKLSVNEQAEPIIGDRPNDR